MQESVITRASEAFGQRVLQHQCDEVFAAQASGFDVSTMAIFVAEGDEGGVVIDDIAIADDAAIQVARQRSPSRSSACSKEPRNTAAMALPLNRYLPLSRVQWRLR